MIDRGDIRQAIDRCSNIWASLPGAGYVLPGIRPTAWLQNARSYGTVREIDAWSRVTAIISALLSASSSACHGLLIITSITPLPTKPGATKNARELKLANAAITDMQMRQRDVAALDAKYTKELADAKAENDAHAMMLPLVVSCTSKQSVSQCVKLPPPPAWIMGSLPLTGRHRWTGIISPSERGWSLCKNNWKEPIVYAANIVSR